MLAQRSGSSWNHVLIDKRHICGALLDGEPLDEVCKLKCLIFVESEAGVILLAQHSLGYKPASGRDVKYCYIHRAG